MSHDSLRRFRQGYSPFDEIKHVEDDGTEWWSARELMPLLGYVRWENMVQVIKRARAACRNSGVDPTGVFRDTTKNVDAGPLQRGRADVQMLRYGCYLVALNGDPEKPEVAAAQAYFVVKTRAAELQVEVPTPTPMIGRSWSERFRDTLRPHVCHVNIHHPGCFTVVSTLVPFLLDLEDELIRHLLNPRPSDRPDGSVGQCWAHERRERGLPAVERFAPLYLREQDLDVKLRVYDNSERGTFEAWFYNTYLPEKLPNYLMNKPEFNRYGQLPPASAADHACLGWAGQKAHLKPRVRKQLVAAGGFFPVGTKVPQLEHEQRNMFDLFGE